MKPRLITHEGETKSVAAWARQFGIDKNTLLFRLDNDWDVHRALTEPVSAKQRKGHPWKRYNPNYYSGMRSNG